MCGFVVDTGSELEKSDVEREFTKIHHRGPDSTLVKESGKGTFFFHRLAIMGPDHSGDQPFETSDLTLVCNGEVYNYLELKKDAPDYPYKSESDCEVILPLYKKWGLDKLCRQLDAEFAFCLHDKEKDIFIAARDSIGIRPLFYGLSAKGEYLFSSEAKCLTQICPEVKVFPPGHYWTKETGFVSYKDLTKMKRDYERDKSKALKDIRDSLIAGVEKRLMSDVPLGFLLSGGLDSSLVCGIATKILDKKITTFAVGIDERPIDTKYAKVVADYIKSDHHEYLFNFKDVLTHLKDIIFHLETYDITTIRASVGMYLLCKYIKEETDIKVLLTGEVSDELFGYKYTDFAPSPEEFQKEAQKRIHEIHQYDVLRCDRCISAHSLEARVPFGDHDFVEKVMHIDPLLKMNTTGVGKYLLREAFKHDDFIPHDILMREKAAFSDAVGHSMVDRLKMHAEDMYTQEEFEEKIKKYPHARPVSKEALMYREIFEDQFSGRSYLVKDFWLPNREWENCDVIDPSARALPNYGKSGE